MVMFYHMYTAIAFHILHITLKNLFSSLRLIYSQLDACMVMAKDLPAPLMGVRILHMAGVQISFEPTMCTVVWPVTSAPFVFFIHHVSMERS